MIAPSPIVDWSRLPAPPIDLGGPTNAYRPFLESSIEQPALHLFRGIAQEFDERIACEDADSSLTYGQVWASCWRLAMAMGTAVAPGRPVGVLLPNEASYPVAVLACLATGSPCVMIDRFHPADRIAAIIRDAGLSAVIVKQIDLDDGLLLPAGIRTIVIDDALREGPVPDVTIIKTVPPAAPSFIVYTSGSTGQPKGIVLSQRTVLHRAWELINSVHLRPEDKVLSLASPSTIGGLQQIFEVMLSGASLVKIDLQRVGLGRVADLIAERRITMMFSTPVVWRSLCRLDGARDALAGLRCIQSSGDALLRIDFEEVRRVLSPDCHVLSVYGATEAPALLQWFASASPPADEARVPAGYVLDGFLFAVIDENGKTVPHGEPGELVVKSPWMSLGLWRDGAVHPGLFERDSREPDLPVYRTGDIVRLRPDGLFVTFGRKDRQIKIRGNRVELAEIEAALRRAALCSDAAVVARRMEGEPRIWAFIVPRGLASANTAVMLRTYLSEVLPSYMRPNDIFVIDELPLLPGRKVDEEALVAQAMRSLPGRMGEAGPVPSVASSRSTDIVTRAWRRALGRRPPSDNRSFDEASGDSLKLLQLIFHIERLSGVFLPLERFHGKMRPSEFSLELDRFAAGDPLAKRDGRPVVFLVPGYDDDEPQLAQFRAICALDIQFRVIGYPPLSELATGGFEGIVNHIVARIERAAPQGAIALAGYSIGGEVAWAVAGRLLTNGRTISVLCILDGNATGVEIERGLPAPVARQSRLARLRQIVRGRRWNELVAGILPRRLVVKPLALRGLRALLVFKRAMPDNVVFYLRRYLRAVIIMAYHRAWIEKRRSVQLKTPIVLFRSEEGFSISPMTWGGKL